MSYLVVAAIGLLSTLVMTSVHLIAERTSLGVIDFTKSATAFVLPERLRSGTGLMFVMHALGGVLFVFAYAYVLDFLQPAVLTDYIRVGALGGIIHGFFIGLFFLAFHPDGGLDTFHLPSGMLNFATHVLYGLLVGLGLGLYQVQGHVGPFAFGAVLATGLMWAVANLLTPERKKRTWRRLVAQRRADANA